MVCITQEKHKLVPEDNQERKLQKENYDFQMNPFFRVQKKWWTESLCLHLAADSLAGPFIMLFAFYIADFVIIDLVHCLLWGVFNT